MSKLPSILLNKDFYTKPRNRKWIKDQGAEAIIILQAFWLASSQEKDCKIRKDEALCISYPLPLEESRITEILNSAVDVGLLDADKEHYFNSQIIKDQENLVVKQEKWKEKKKRQRKESLGTERGQSGDIAETSRGTLNNEHMNNELMNNEFRKEGTGGNPLPEAPESESSELEQYETHVFIEKWRIPELERWFRNAGFSNPEKAIKYAASIINGSYEKRNIEGKMKPAKCFSDMISWGLQNAQTIKKSKLEVDTAQARNDKTNGIHTPSPPKYRVFNSSQTKQVQLQPEVKQLLKDVIK